MLPFFLLDVSSDSAKLLEQLLSKEVKQLENKDKIIEEQRKEIQAQARRIKELEALASRQ